VAASSWETAVPGPGTSPALKSLPDSWMHRAETSQGALHSAFLPKHSIMVISGPQVVISRLRMGAGKLVLDPFLFPPSFSAFPQQL